MKHKDSMNYENLVEELAGGTYRQMDGESMEERRMRIESARTAAIFEVSMRSGFDPYELITAMVAAVKNGEKQ